MGDIIGTCGHNIHGMDNTLCIKEHDGVGHKCMSIVAICDDCAKFYRKHRLVLKDKKAEHKWLSRKEAL